MNSLVKCALVVDDSVVIRKIASRMLARLGFDVYEAVDGEVALKMLAQLSPDVVLLDWNMPNVNGLEVLRTINKLGLKKRPRIIFCTTETAYDRISEAMQCGADEYIMKPFDEEILRLKLEEVGVVEKH
jgi:two-component system, chemotaxis family, chemotaxis protein CheY